MKVGFVKTITSFDSKFNSKIDSKANDNQPYPITIYHDKHAIKLNALIIIGCKGRKTEG